MSGRFAGTWGSLEMTMRRLLEATHGLLGRSRHPNGMPKRLRVIPDHLNPDIEYMVRGYLLGGGLDEAGEVIHSRFELCLHKILVSDDDYLHNHSAAYFSLIVAGSYREHTLEGVFLRRPGHMRVRSRHTFHRIEIVDGPVWTIFAFLNRDPVDDNWGFLVDGKVVPHEIHLGEDE